MKKQLFGAAFFVFLLAYFSASIFTYLNAKVT